MIDLYVTAAVKRIKPPLERTVERKIGKDPPVCFVPQWDRVNFGKVRRFAAFALVAEHDRGSVLRQEPHDFGKEREEPPHEVLLRNVGRMAGSFEQIREVGQVLGDILRYVRGPSVRHQFHVSVQISRNRSRSSSRARSRRGMRWDRASGNGT